MVQNHWTFGYNLCPKTSLGRCSLGGWFCQVATMAWWGRLRSASYSTHRRKQSPDNIAESNQRDWFINRASAAGGWLRSASDCTNRINQSLCSLMVQIFMQLLYRLPLQKAKVFRPASTTGHEESPGYNFRYSNHTRTMRSRFETRATRDPDS